MLASFGYLIIVLMYSLITFTVAVLAYAKGYNEGRHDGYRRARTVHMATTKYVERG